MRLFVCKKCAFRCVLVVERVTSTPDTCSFGVITPEWEEVMQ